VVGAINGGVGQGGIVTMPRSDGLSDGYNTVQGTRSYDSSVGNWTTPDAYAGDAHDPMSQKPYMYNHNNPLEYEDPSGFLSYIANVGVLGTAYSHNFIEVEQTGDKHPKVFEAGPSPGGLNTLCCSTLKPQPYGNTIVGNTATQWLKPPPGVSDKNWDHAVIATFEELNRELEAKNIRYTEDMNSNTYIAEGLRRLGYSEKEIKAFMGSAARGSDSHLFEDQHAGAGASAQPLFVDAQSR
jgi:RHS repeat-associated protein